MRLTVSQTASSRTTSSRTTASPQASGRTTSGPFLRRSQPWRRRRTSALLYHLRRLLKLSIPIGLPMGLAGWMMSSESFALTRVTVEGSPRVPAHWIRRALEPERGANLLTLPLERVRRRIESHPWAAGVSVRKELPDRLHVDVVEREAVAVLEEEGALYYVDAGGRRIAPVEVGGGNQEGLLHLVSWDLAPRFPESSRLREQVLLARAIEVGAWIEASGPEMWRSRVRKIEVLGGDTFRLHNEKLPFPVLVCASDLEWKTRALSWLLPEILGRVQSIGEVDLRFSGRVVVRPGIEDGSSAT